MGTLQHIHSTWPEESHVPKSERPASRSTSSTLQKLSSSSSTRRRDWCRAQTPTSWTSSAQDASTALEQQLHKKKRLVQGPNSYFMDVKCPGCFNITTVFSHAQTVVQCGSCSTVLCQPTGGKARLTEGCSFRRKA